jgi:hypothetical protein
VGKAGDGWKDGFSRSASTEKQSLTQVLLLAPFSPMDLLGLNFQPSIGVQAAVQCRCGESICPARGLDPMEFFLLVSIGRCKYRVSEHLVGFLFQETLGGCAVDFKLLQIAERVFSFSVASKMWAFTSTSFGHSLVINIKSFSISGAMEVLIGLLNQKNSTRKSKISGRWLVVEISNQRNPLLI